MTTSLHTTRVGCSCRNPSGRRWGRRPVCSMSTPGFRRYTYQTVPGRSGWPSRDPIVESSFRLSYSALLPPQEQLAFLRRLPDGNEYIFVGNRPVYSVDSLGLTKWRGTCYAYGVSVTLGYLFVQCYLESDCSIGADKHSEWVAVKAAMFQAGVGLPASYSVSENTFLSPNGSDHTTFNGRASAYGFSGAIGAGAYFSALSLGGADMQGLTGTQSGIDVSAFMASGRSWVNKWSKSCCSGNK